MSKGRNVRRRQARRYFRYLCAKGDVDVPWSVITHLGMGRPRSTRQRKRRWKGW